MSESSSTEQRAPHDTTEDDGWCLEKHSWAFHRSAFRILGHPLAFGEYGYIRRQIGSGEAEILRFGDRDGLYRTRLRDGTVLDVLALTRKGKKGRNVWHELTRAIRPGGKQRAAPVPAPPEPAPIRRAPTLTLGATAPRAAEALAARLQPKPPPPRLASAPTRRPARAQDRRKV